ncbi:transposase [Spirosoma sp. BT702]|uniref:Transposase n=1 Tax=Spirosoma profusum TaxID=2771354 RepID=A0A927AWI4_9BACT|nr:transposase [Spirosoma profusum]MBD2705748.1 transposase [Spirosoma profusum]
MKEQKNTKSASRRKYDQDFKTEALRMIANGRSVLQVAQALGLGENLLYRWRSRQESSGTKGKEKVDSPLAIENERLRHQLRQSEEEREILKKALAIFSRQT